MPSVQANAAGRYVHFSVFSDAFAQRLVTQMYFPGDPLLPLDPLFNAMPDPAASDPVRHPSSGRA